MTYRSKFHILFTNVLEHQENAGSKVSESLFQGLKELACKLYQVDACVLEFVQGIIACQFCLWIKARQGFSINARMLSETYYTGMFAQECTCRLSIHFHHMNGWSSNKYLWQRNMKGRPNPRACFMDRFHQRRQRKVFLDWRIAVSC